MLGRLSNRNRPAQLITRSNKKPISSLKSISRLGLKTGSSAPGAMLWPTGRRMFVSLITTELARPW
jgi:hypothetical protein